MIKMQFDPKDLLEFHIMLENLDPKKVLAGEWRGFLTPMKRELRTYPPPPQGSKYKRTFNLKRNWQYAVLSPTSAEVSNMAAYAGWVQGIEQAPIHVGRWSKMVDIAEKHLDEFVKKLSNKFGKIWIR